MRPDTSQLPNASAIANQCGIAVALSVVTKRANVGSERIILPKGEVEFQFGSGRYFS